tara:strand:- start:707 stop:1042 length:336 start_codon:yes stop_codon:yes gene_type:complete
MKVKDINVSDCEIIRKDGRGRYFASCPDHGRQELKESGFYIDPSYDRDRLLNIGWGGSCFVYRCPECSRMLVLRESLEWYGPDDLCKPLDLISEKYSQEDVDSLLKLIAID